MLCLKQRIVHSKAMLLCLVFCEAAIQPVIGQKWRIGYSSIMGVGLQSEKNVYYDDGGFGNQYKRGLSSSLVGIYGIYQPRQWMWMAQLQFTTIEQRFETSSSGIPGVNDQTKFRFEHPTIQLSLSASYPFAIGRSMQLSPFFGATFQYLDRNEVSVSSKSTYTNSSTGTPIEYYSWSSYGSYAGIQFEPRIGIIFRPNIVHPFWKRINIMSYAQFGTTPMTNTAEVNTSTRNRNTNQIRSYSVTFQPAFTQIMLGVGIDIFQIKKK